MQIQSIKTLVAPLLVLLLGALVMNYLVAQRPSNKAAPPAARPLVVAVETVNPAPLNAAIRAWGRLTSSQPLTLLAEASGELLAGELAFRPGQSFSRGQVLLRVDDRQQRLSVNRAKTDLLNALAALLPDLQLQLPQQWARWEAYFNAVRFDRPLPELPDSDSEQIKRLLTRHQVYNHYYRCRSEEIALEKYRIVAPFDGTVLTADMREGANIRPGTRLGQLLNLEQLELVVELPVDDVRWLDRAAAVDIYSAQLQQHWRGTISRLGRSVDINSQTLPLYIALPAEVAAVAAEGLLLEVQMVGLAVEQAVSVSLKNIYEQNYVYLLEQGALRKRQIDVRRREAERALVSGLTAGDQLVTDLLQGVADGMAALSVSEFDAQRSAP